MKFCDKEIQDHLLKGGKIIDSRLAYPLFFDEYDRLSYQPSYDRIIHYSLSRKDLKSNSWKVVMPDF